MIKKVYGDLFTCLHWKDDKAGNLRTVPLGHLHVHFLDNLATDE